MAKFRVILWIVALLILAYQGLILTIIHPWFAIIIFSGLLFLYLYDLAGFYRWWDGFKKKFK